MSIKVITDSSADIYPGEMEDVIVIALNVEIDGKNYKDGVDITKDDFYRLQESCEGFPMSSLASPLDFEDVYKELKANGDEAIVLPISSGLSSTLQSATIAAEDYDNISVLDSKQVTSSLKMLVLRTLQLIKSGLSRAEIVKILEKERDEVRVFAFADTLKYLEKGGRITKTAAVLGGIIGIKPILEMIDGKLLGVDKARGLKMAFRKLDEKIVAYGGINYDKPFVIGYSGIGDENMMSYVTGNPLIDAENHGPLIFNQTGSAVGTHLGPGAVIVSFFSKD